MQEIKAVAGEAGLSGQADRPVTRQADPEALREALRGGDFSEIVVHRETVNSSDFRWLEGLAQALEGR